MFGKKIPIHSNNLVTCLVQNVQPFKRLICNDKLDKETASETGIIPRYFNGVDGIYSNQEAVIPKHVLESSL